MSKIVRTVRFDHTEIKKIEEFLGKNEFLDFSSLTRMAISRFIEKPTVQIQPIKASKVSQKQAEA